MICDRFWFNLGPILGSIWVQFGSNFRPHFAILINFGLTFITCELKFCSINFELHFTKGTTRLPISLTKMPLLFLKESWIVLSPFYTYFARIRRFTLGQLLHRLQVRPWHDLRNDKSADKIHSTPPERQVSWHFQQYFIAILIFLQMEFAGAR